MKRQPLIDITRKLRQMTYARKCQYLIACRNCEIEGSERWRWMQGQLELTRTAQVKQETTREREFESHF